MIKRKSDFKFNENCKYTAYILGFLWADGWLQCRNNNPERINTEITKDDFNNIKPIFKKLNIKLFCTFRNRPNRKSQATLAYSDKSFIEFLIKNDYINRKEKGFYKIVKNFNKNTINYFLKGLFDGDGCYYINSLNSTHQISLSSSYEQDYVSIGNILKSYKITYKIKRVKDKNSYSILRMSSLKDCNLFINYILKDAIELGLDRKKEKIYQLKSKIDEKKNKNKKVICLQ